MSEVNGGAGSAAISIRGVTKRFTDKTAVDRLDLDVPAGSVCGFLGPNGAGKTTTIRMIMGIILPDEGQVQVLGRTSAIESKDRIGYLPEERGVYRTMRVGDFLTYMARLKGVDAHGLSKKIDAWLERLALPGVRKKRCQELSKGMQQKVQFAATVLHEPDLIILDEPFSGLDPVNARLLRSLIQDQQAAGRTIIFSTHVLFSAEQLCDRVFMINRGKKILDGTLEQIRSAFDPRTIVVEPADPGADLSRLSAIAGVENVAKLGRAGAAELRLAEGTDKHAMLAKVAATPGLALRRLELRAVTLEDVFISLVDPGDSEDDVRRSLAREDEPMEVGADA